MEWIQELIWNNSAAHTVILLAFVIIVGTGLGKIKIKGVSLGMTMVVFVGIAMSHFEFTLDPNILNFVRDFGLIFFVYAVGLQVGPGFFSAFKRGGLQMNILVLTIVILGSVVTVSLHYITDISMSTMTGIFAGATTSTTGLGAAQETYASMNNGVTDPSIAMGYIVAYPLGIFGSIISIILLRYILRINIPKEIKQLEDENARHNSTSQFMSLEVQNPSLFGLNMRTINGLVDKNFVVSRVMNDDGTINIASSDTVLNEGDKVLVTSSPHDSDAIQAFIGRSVDMTIDNWTQSKSDLVSRKILVTKSSINGKTLAQINLRREFGVNVTRLNRSGINLIAHPNLQLHIGDRVVLVGTKEAIAGAEKILGNEVKQLNEPNLIPLLIGISLGVIVGSIPLVLPGMPQPVKLGLSGGLIIVSILMSVFGPKFKLVTYTTASANLMMKEMGISVFLACVGLASGETFVDTIVNNDGLLWIGLGLIITVIPILLTGIIGRFVFKLNFLKLMGVIAGGTAGAPLLSYANGVAGSEIPAVSYATVYPLSIFLRVVAAQVLILMFV